MIKYTDEVIICEVEDGYLAYMTDDSGLYTIAHSAVAALANLEDALNGRIPILDIEE